MKTYNLLIIISLLTILSCRKDLSITEFSDDFSDYEPELRIEALILPTENTAIVRIDKSYTLMDATLYDCIDNDFSINGEITLDSCNTKNGFWHGIIDNINDKITLDSCNTVNGIWYEEENSTVGQCITVGHCGDWNSLIHDVGIDGEIGDPTDEDEDCSDCSATDTLCQENCLNEDSIGENNGVPDCNEPNVDNYNEVLPNIHDSKCIVSMIKINSDGSEEICDFHFDSEAGSFFDIQYTGSENVLIDDIITTHYGAFVPNDECSSTMWSNTLGKADTESKYSFNADCSEAGFGNITSKEPITVSNPVVFVDTIFDPTIHNPQNQVDVAEYLENLGIANCASYDCLEENNLILENNSAYFPRYSDSTFVLWATISPNLYFQATQYMYDSTMVNSSAKYFHGHPAVGTDFFNIVNDVCLMSEAVVSFYYDGYGNGEWDDSTDKGNAEIFADENGNGVYDEGEFFIDTADGIGEIDTYYYEISTFSESYKNYYFYPQLLPNDPVRSNLRGENGEFIMGAFGSITTNRIDFQIIDCLDFTYDSSNQDFQWTYTTQEDCENNATTHGVCQWYENKTIDFFNAPTYSGNVCAPINFWE